MSYKPASSIYKLQFEAPHLQGLEVSARSTTLGKLREIMQTNVSSVDPATYTEVFQFFATRIVNWNIVHPEISEYDEKLDVCGSCGLAEDSPMPPNFKSLMCLDSELIVVIIQSWISAVTDVEIPKGKNTSNGGQTEKLLVTLPTETLPIPNLVK